MTSSNIIHPAVISSINSSLNRVWELSQKDNMEHLIMLSRTSGKILGEADGDRNKVDFPKGITPETAKDALVVHSHPLFDTGVSLPDMLAALGNEFPVFAISPSKSITWVDGKRLGMTALLGPDFFEATLSRYIITLNNKLIRILGWPDDGILDRPDDVKDNWRYGALTHFATLRADLTGLVNYRFHFTPELEAMMDKVGKALGASPCRAFSGWRDSVEVI